jgi:hypothetical protein
MITGLIMISENDNRLDIDIGLEMITGLILILDLK